MRRFSLVTKSWWGAMMRRGKVSNPSAARPCIRPRQQTFDQSAFFQTERLLQQETSIRSTPTAPFSSKKEYNNNESDWREATCTDYFVRKTVCQSVSVTVCRLILSVRMSKKIPHDICLQKFSFFF